MRRFLIIVLICGWFSTVSAAQRGGGPGGRDGESRGPRESRDAASNDDSRASRRGNPAETLKAAEAKAAEAENAGHWEEAAAFYITASRAARAAGQFQKAVNHGVKAFDLAARANDAFLQTSATLQTAFALRNVGQKAKAREWLEKGLAAAKAVEPPPRRFWIESKVYRELGLDLLRAGEVKKAIEYIDYARSEEEQRLALFKRPRAQAGPRLIAATQYALVRTLHHLGVAHERAGDTAAAVKSFNAGIQLIQQARLKTPVEATLHQALGELYLKQKDYPLALKSLGAALAIAEQRRQENVVATVGAEIGEIHLQNKNSAEAMRYYKKAIDSIESTRSLLETEEYRRSFFEDKRRTYAGYLLAQLQTKDFAAAFDTSERARSRAFLDILGSRVELARGPLLEEERRLRAAIAAFQAQLARREDDEEDVDEAEEEENQSALSRGLDEAQRAYEAFLARIKNENREQA